MTWQPWTAATLIGSYLPHESEFDPTLLAQAARARGADIVCPRVDGKSLSFHHWQADDEAEATIGGVLQPLPTAPVVDAAAIDLFLTPLLGCGDSGMRLGYGGGFYDRTLSGLRAAGRHVVALGIAYDGQLVDKVPTGPYDMRLDGVLTPSGLRLAG